MRGLIANPLFYAAILAISGPIVSRLTTKPGTPSQFVVRLVSFALITCLMWQGGVVPTQTLDAGDGHQKIAVAILTIAWWLSVAWLTVGLVRWGFYLRGKRESKLVHDLIAAVTYTAAIFSILGHVFDLPIKGLLATSGALAIIIGLALQNSLGDVFSGIFLSIERPYTLGDWIIIDDSLQGRVIETNWRATRIITGAQDVAIIPNSAIAKAKLVNCSSPTALHSASTRIKLASGPAPALAVRLLEDVLRSAHGILASPAPGVTIKDISAEFLDLELGYSVRDLDQLGPAQSELFDRVDRALAACGMGFAWRNTPPAAAPQIAADTALRLAGSNPIFSMLAPEELSQLASQMQRSVYAQHSPLIEGGVVMDSLFIILSGVVQFTLSADKKRATTVCLTAGDYFGEQGILMGQPIPGDAVALTRVVVYTIPKETLVPLIRSRPLLAEEFSEALASRRSRVAALLHLTSPQPPAEGTIEHLAATIRNLFASHVKKA